LFGSTLRNRWDADVALRAGVAVDRALLYSKVGAAWGRFDLAADLVFANRVDPQRASGVLTGLLLGTGLEYAFAGNWSAKAEYNYIGYFGKVLHVDTNVLIDPSYDQTISATKHIVKLGINYRFAGDDAVVVKY
jgi:outer membrane immunogenic protein